MRLRIDLLIKRLKQTCPQMMNTETYVRSREYKRASVSAKQLAIYGHSLTVDRGVYNHVLGLLQKCYEDKHTGNTRPRPPTVSSINPPSVTTTPAITTPTTTSTKPTYDNYTNINHYLFAPSTVYFTIYLESDQKLEEELFG